VKPERVEEHEGLVRGIFAELAEKKPAGLRYGAFKQPDGVSFVHLAVLEGDSNPLQTLAAFRAFTEKIGERCDEAPASFDLNEVGTFGL
jgi:hypothetical protein